MQFPLPWLVPVLRTTLTGSKIRRIDGLTGSQRKSQKGDKDDQGEAKELRDPSSRVVLRSTGPPGLPYGSSWDPEMLMKLPNTLHTLTQALRRELIFMSKRCFVFVLMPRRCFGNLHLCPKINVTS